MQKDVVQAFFGGTVFLTEWLQVQKKVQCSIQSGCKYKRKYSVPYRVVASKEEEKKRETGKLKSPARQQSQRRGFVHETFRIRKTEQFQFKTD